MGGENMNTIMPVGIENFKEARDAYYVVDKTRLICQLLENHEKVTLFTRPRRFGKTLTMSMLAYFFSVDTSVESKNLFKGMDVEKAGEKYMKEQGAYPVIFLTLKGITGRSWQNAYDLFTFVIQKEYLKHSYLWNADVLLQAEKEYCKRIVEGKARIAEYQMSLLQLTEFLYRYFKKKPIILIDEYDVPIQSAYEHDFYEEAMDFFRGWFNAALKGNEFLQFAVLTGVLRIAKESIFSGLNNLEVYSVLQQEYSDIFGFTTEEVQQIARDFNEEDKLPEIQKWYDGYSFGGTDIYNPLSVGKYFRKHCVPDVYWVNTSNNFILKKLLYKADTDRIKALQRLMDGESVSTVLEEGLIYDDLEQEDASLYSLMLNTGYLKAVHVENETNGINVYDVKIPNEEIKLIYKRDILSTIVQGIQLNVFINFQKALVHGDAAYVSAKLAEILLKMVSFYDTHPKESFYHGLLLGMTCLLEGSMYQVESNQESGYGRFDLAIFPRNAAKAGVIMEFKVAKTETTLDDKAQEALQQIETKSYITEFQKRNIQHVWKYGIAFCGKHVKIVQSI